MIADSPAGFNTYDGWCYTGWPSAGVDSKPSIFNDLAHYLSINGFLKASPHMSVLMGVWSGMVATIPIGFGMPVAMVIGGLLSIPRLGPLLNRVSSLRDGQSLPRLDPGYLVDLDFCLWRMLDVDVHQGWVERH